MRVAILLFNSIPETLISLAEACLALSPQICLNRSDALFIEIGKCRQLYNEETFIEKIELILKKFALKPKIIIADSILDALILAKYHTLSYAKLPLSCFYEYLNPFLIHPEKKARTHSQNAQQAISKQDEKGRAEAPSSLIKDEIFLDSMIESLEKVGIRNIEEFLKIPPEELSSRFGKRSLLLRLRILGEQDPGWPLWVPHEPIFEKQDLIHSGVFSDLESLFNYLMPVLERVFSRLLGRGLSALGLKLTLDLEKNSIVKEPLREWFFELIFPQSTVQGILPILRERLARDLAYKPLSSNVLAISIEVLQTTKNDLGQKNFFHSFEEIQNAFYSTVNLLIESSGNGNIFQVSLHEEALPEKSWNRSFSKEKTHVDLNNYIPIRPTRVLKKPLDIQIHSDYVNIRGRSYKILKWSVIEQLSTDWIDQEVNRSYYRVDLQNKPPIWIFKDPTDRYFLHGYFE